MLRILYKMTARTRRFCFFLLQHPSNVRLVVCVVYLFCLIVYCTDCTTCNMLNYRLQQYHIRHCSCTNNLHRETNKQTQPQFSFTVYTMFTTTPQFLHKKKHTKSFNMKDNTVEVKVSVHKLLLL
jgi:hypothetical protein